MYTLLLLLAPLAVSAISPIGGVTPVDFENTKENMDKVWMGMAAVNAVSDSPNYLVPVKVVGATRQVVSGMKYTFDVEMAETECIKATSNFDRNTCVASANAPTSLYKVTLWEQPWLNYSEYSAEKIIQP